MEFQLNMRESIVSGMKEKNLTNKLRNIVRPKRIIKTIKKNKIEQRLGKQIISQANLDYANLSNDQIKLLAKQFSEFLKVKSVDH